jgi:hypothetical protein
MGPLLLRTRARMPPSIMFAAVSEIACSDSSAFIGFSHSLPECALDVRLRRCPGPLSRRSRAEAPCRTEVKGLTGALRGFSSRRSLRSSHVSSSAKLRVAKTLEAAGRYCELRDEPPSAPLFAALSLPFSGRNMPPLSGGFGRNALGVIGKSRHGWDPSLAEGGTAECVKS